MESAAAASRPQTATEIKDARLAGLLLCETELHGAPDAAAPNLQASALEPESLNLCLSALAKNRNLTPSEVKSNVCMFMSRLGLLIRFFFWRAHNNLKVFAYSARSSV